MWEARLPARDRRYMRKPAESWLAYAHTDLRAAQTLVNQSDLTGVATFHCQQCIEKALKALLVFNGQDVPRIHDLVTLHKRTSEVVMLPIEATELVQVNDAYIDTRYPNDTDAASRQVPSEEKTKVFLSLSENVYEFARAAIRQTPDTKQNNIT